MMQRRDFLKLMGVGAVSAMCNVEALAGPRRGPNIVLIIADDMGWDDCGAYGHPSIRTPNIDGLAADGMRFTNAFLTASSCSPSRASIVTGQYSHSTDAEQLHWPLPAEQRTFVERLKETIPFYSTRHFVKPGVTGWAQVCYPYGASDEDALEKLRYDLFYIKNYSVLLDFKIILDTIRVVTSGFGGR